MAQDSNAVPAGYTEQQKRQSIHRMLGLIPSNHPSPRKDDGSQYRKIPDFTLPADVKRRTGNARREKVAVLVTVPIQRGNPVRLILTTKGEIGIDSSSGSESFLIEPDRVGRFIDSIASSDNVGAMYDDLRLYLTQAQKFNAD